MLSYGGLGYDFKRQKILRKKFSWQIKWSDHGRTGRTADYGPGLMSRFADHVAGSSGALDPVEHGHERVVAVGGGDEHARVGELIVAPARLDVARVGQQRQRRVVAMTLGHHVTLQTHLLTRDAAVPLTDLHATTTGGSRIFLEGVTLGT